MKNLTAVISATFVLCFLSNAEAGMNVYPHRMKNASLKGTWHFQQSYTKKCEDINGKAVRCFVHSRVPGPITRRSGRVIGYHNIHGFIKFHHDKQGILEQDMTINYHYGGYQMLHTHRKWTYKFKVFKKAGKEHLTTEHQGNKKTYILKIIHNRLYLTQVSRYNRCIFKTGLVTPCFEYEIQIFYR